MCRSIKRLREPHGGPRANDEQVREAALQFVRKVSGFHRPSQRNAPAFDRAVSEVASASRRLLEELTGRVAPR